MKIDFHILENASGSRAMLYVCTLLEKEPEKQTYIHTNSRDEAERLDTLLWTYKDDSFIPHNLYDPADQFPPAIQIGYDKTPTHHQDTLISLHREIPAFYNQFNHIIEIVFSDPHVQQLARERYKQYREQGHELNTLKIKLANHD